MDSIVIRGCSDYVLNQTIIIETRKITISQHTVKSGFDMAMRVLTIGPSVLRTSKPQVNKAAQSAKQS